jgi:hypothetical protein
MFAGAPLCEIIVRRTVSGPSNSRDCRSYALRSPQPIQASHVANEVIGSRKQSHVFARSRADLLEEAKWRRNLSPYSFSGILQMHPKWELFPVSAHTGLAFEIASFKTFLRA